MKKILIILSIMGLVAVVSVSSYYSGIKSPLDASGRDVDFRIEKGQNVETISANLESARLIKSAFYFKIYMKESGLASKLQAGDYVLSAKYSIKEIVEILSQGKIVSKEKTVKVLEGWNMMEMADYFEKERIFEGEDFLALAGNRLVAAQEKYKNNLKDYASAYDFLKDRPAKASLEGYLFPDTYRISANAGPDEVIRKMLDNFGKKVDEKMMADIRSQGKSLYEILTMASLIEKEVKSLEDKKMVSGIFWNRIGNGQALESCATLAYVLGENKKQYTLEDTKVQSPYNTYENKGLPPGPIANPGLDAIIAAIYPTPNDYVFFLSRFDNGETVFSKTYEEHLRNKAKYLQ